MNQINTRMNDLPQIVITIGDPNGIGPEIILKVLSDGVLEKKCRTIVVGPTTVMSAYMEMSSLSFRGHVVHDLSERTAQAHNVVFFDPGFDVNYTPQPGRLHPLAGEIAGKALDFACQILAAKKADAVVTAPLSKKALNLAGFRYPGQTEFFAKKAGIDNIVMVMLGKDLRIALATTHCPLRNVPGMLSKELLLSKLQILNLDLQERFNLPRPKIGVAALNPHAGESGLFGFEEQEILLPAVQEAQHLGINAHGPYPADTLFARHKHHGFDAYLAMYHDQGLIPVKMAAFGSGINYTAGLPFIRTSPDHGTAFDIAGKGMADPNSMKEAIKLAADLASKTKIR